ncbi:MAG TPA: FAD-dependent monooxygenase [Candidatus Dormibacteraeota bacterium]
MPRGPLRIACVGGGPGGLSFAAQVRRTDPSIEVTVFERNRPDDTFGFGVVFSDATLANLQDADPVLRDALAAHGVHWDRIEVRLKGRRLHCAGNGMAAIARRTLLSLLQTRAAEAGADLRFQTDVARLDDLDGYDLVVAADGANSRIRAQLADIVSPTVEVAAAKFIWFGTTHMFEGLTFVHERGPHGVFAVHGYPISEDVSTFIVETDEVSWRRAGLDAFDVTQPPGPSDLCTKTYLEALFAEHLEGCGLLVNNSRWGNFRTLRSARWRAGRVVLLGDAVHTAHFSVGSGTKMAMEDAVALATAIAEHGDDLDGALAAYEERRQPLVRRIQDSARPSLSWWEHFGRYHDALEPTQFAFHFLTRALSRAKLERRDPGFVASVERAWLDEHHHEPLSTPLRLGTRAFGGRVLSVEELDGAGAFRLTAPATEQGLEYAALELERGVARAPELVVVDGGTSLTRTLLAEECRMLHHVPAVVVEEAFDRDRALRLVLSGRADAVAVPAAVLAGAEVMA